ncbi:MAG: hypothetical protein IPP49_08610 [Saprospiraceae bacterium]|nr:hypothetical protein [Saprospiraceae bacterium]
MKILAKELDCGKISFTLLKDKDDFRANHFLYYTFIGIELLNDDCSKLDSKDLQMNSSNVQDRV